ncbi:MAG: HepT-like ribonuclease domain-containing protein [Nanoarchaeota archaeon]
MDYEIIAKYVMFLTENLKEIEFGLNELEDKNLSKRVKDLLKKSLERLAEEVIECATKINDLILFEENIDFDSYYDSFKNLSLIEFFKDNLEFFEKIASSAGFRNRLAQDYLDLDERITMVTIRRLPKLYKDYLILIQEYLVDLQEKEEQESKK